MATREHDGFTLIELLIVMAITGILGTFVIMAYANLNSSQALGKDTALVSSLLNQARVLTLSSKNDTQYGVHFEAGSVTRFAGASYSALDPANTSFPLNSQVAVSTNLAGGATDVVFERLTGKTLQSGTVTLYLPLNASSTRSLTIFATGLIQNN